MEFSDKVRPFRGFSFRQSRFLLLALCGIAIALPMLVMYIASLAIYYDVNPQRWHKGKIPYISGLLGEGHDTVEQGKMREAAWNAAVLIACSARVCGYVSMGRTRQILIWMSLYYPVWALTVATAYWDAHEEMNPFHKFVSGAILHYAASAVMFVVGGSESYFLNVDRLFPGNRGKVKTFLMWYIGIYCLLFAANKLFDLPVDLGHQVLPLFEHGMFLGHVAFDAIGTALLEGEEDAASRDSLEVELMALRRSKNTVRSTGPVDPPREDGRSMFSPGLALAGLAIFVPMFVMYVACLAIFYDLDPKRWHNHKIPYISGMLGEHKDSIDQGRMRMKAWNFAVFIACLSRVCAYVSERQGRKIAGWMALYYPVWFVTVVTAFWDAHSEQNPFQQWISGALLHYAASFVMFIVGGSESFFLNVDLLFPGQRQEVKKYLSYFIAFYGLLFVLNKVLDLPVDLGHAVLPLFEHIMFLGHATMDALGTARLQQGRSRRVRWAADGSPSVAPLLAEWDGA